MSESRRSARLLKAAPGTAFSVLTTPETPATDADGSSGHQLGAAVKREIRIFISVDVAPRRAEAEAGRVGAASERVEAVVGGWTWRREGWTRWREGRTWRREGCSRWREGWTWRRERWAWRSEYCTWGRGRCTQRFQRSEERWGGRFEWRHKEWI